MYRRNLFVLFISTLLLFTLALGALLVYSGTAAGVPAEGAPESVQSDSPAAVTAPLYSANAILLDAGGGVLLAEGANDRIYPASMTKIMTALVILEHLDDVTAPVTLDPDLFDPLYAEGAALAGFLPGETVPAIDLLYGLMLPSGAECAAGLARYVAGSEAAFVELMNAEAEALGLEGTHFTNTTGLHDPDHYSTVYDIARLLQCALENDTFYDLFTTPYHATGATDLHPEGITVYSSLFSRVEDTAFTGGRILGGKTGYTEAAGLCLASLAEAGGETYILVTAGAGGGPDTEPYHIYDALAVYNQLQSL